MKRHFNFLIEEYGFSELGRNCGYVKGPLEIEFYTGKGETDIVIFVRRDDDVFRPYISRSFDLLSVAKIEKGVKLEKPESSSQYVVSTEENDKFLAYCARIMKSGCKNILSGNLSTLEKIHLERRKNA